MLVTVSNPELASMLETLKHGGVSEAELETQEKRGRDTGLRAVHPVTGEHVPVFVANFVLMNYGTGAVMAVPGHDQRDDPRPRARTERHLADHAHPGETAGDQQQGAA